MKLKISDFQSIKNADIVFNTGVTTIVGDSNAGKTAIVRAITSLLTNPSEAKTYINYDAKSTSVNLEYNGNNITWERTEKESFYKINGELHQKVGRTDLFELLPNCGFEKEEDGTILNIEDEYSYLYPFYKTDSQIYKTFEGAFQINNSSEVLQKIKVDESGLKKNISELDSSLVKTKDKINKINVFMEKNSEEYLSSKKIELEEKALKLVKLNSDCEIINSNIDFVNKCDKIELKEFDISIFNNYLTLCSDIKLIESDIKLVNSNLILKGFDFKLFHDYFKLEEDCTFITKNIKFITSKVKLKEFDFKFFDGYFKLEKDVLDIVTLIQEYKKLDTEGKQIQEELKDIELELSKVEICPLCSQEMRSKNLL